MIKFELPEQAEKEYDSSDLDSPDPESPGRSATDYITTSL
jgi:hypothetical protein